MTATYCDISNFNKPLRLVPSYNQRNRPFEIGAISERQVIHHPALQNRAAVIHLPELGFRLFPPESMNDEIFHGHSRAGLNAKAEFLHARSLA